jgi:hypothetical protein
MSTIGELGAFLARESAAGSAATPVRREEEHAPNGAPVAQWGTT